MRSRKAEHEASGTPIIFLLLLALLSLFSSCLLAFRLVFMWRPCVWSIGWLYHRTDRTSKQQPCPRYSECSLSARLLRFYFFSFFPFIYFTYSSFLSPLRVFVFFLFRFLFFSSAHKIPWTMFLVLFGCTWYGMVYHCSLVPFPSRTGGILSCRAHYFVLVRFLPSRCIFVYSLFCDHSQDFREVS